MEKLIDIINEENAKAFTHSGKFHADDVFASALIMYFNQDIEITRGNKVPDDFDGIVYDVGRGKYDHHQRDSRVRENGIAYAAFGLLWEELGAEILGEELAKRFDEEFVQKLDNNDNTGEKNEIASLIADFNPSWDEEGNNDEQFFNAIDFASIVLENKFSKYLGNERADKQIDEYIKIDQTNSKILILPKFVPCQKKLSSIDVEFVIFPSNRGGYCIQPVKKENSLNYKCSFVKDWLGLENDELQKVTGLPSAVFCHKGGFIMTVNELEDAVKACKISQKSFVERKIIIAVADDISILINQLSENVEILNMDSLQMPKLRDGEMFYEVDMESEEWRKYYKNIVKKIVNEKPEAVYVDTDILISYPLIHLLNKKKIPVIVKIIEGNNTKLVRIPACS